MSRTLPENWQIFLHSAGVDPNLWQHPLRQVNKRRLECAVFPPEDKVFNAFLLTPPEKVQIILLGQDPYHDDGQAEGLAFSVPHGIPLPPSLRNIFKEYSADLNRPAPQCGHLGQWAKDGMLLLNSVLTVDAHAPGSHAGFGWEKFTDAVISALSTQRTGLVFMLWGGFARKKSSLIDHSKHTVLENAHPSPLSAYRGFFGSHPFSAVQNALPDWKW